MEEKSLVRVTMEIQDVSRYNKKQRDDKFVYETTYTDTGLEDMLQGIYGGLVAMTFDPKGILEGMIQFAIDKIGGEYYPEGDIVHSDENEEVEDGVQ